MKKLCAIFLLLALCTVFLIACDETPSSDTGASESEGTPKEELSHVHEFGDWTSILAPTCVTQGVETRACTVCSHKEVRTTDAIGTHSFGKWETISAPVCVSEGTEIRVCTVCSQTEQRSVAATGIHSFGAWETIHDPSCTEDGSYVRSCNFCSVTETSTKEVVGAHAYVLSESQSATKTVDGFARYSCQHCPDTYTDVLHATGSEGLFFHLSPLEGSYSVSLGTCTETEIVIPAYHEGLPVAAIDYEGFANNTLLSSVTVLSGVSRIDSYAFAGCTSLQSVSLPNSVLIINNSAFENCSSLEEIDLPDAIEGIRRSVFAGCTSLEELIFPQSVTQVSEFAFARCVSLKTIRIPESLTVFADTAFEDCLPEHVTLPMSALNKIPNASLKSVVLLDGTILEDNSFLNCSYLCEVTLPRTLVTIGDSAFKGCSSLASLTLPEGVRAIGNSAFSGCSLLHDLTIPAGVETIGSNGFSSCSSLSEVVLPVGMTRIEEGTFAGCSVLRSVTVPQGLSYIGANAFYNCFKLHSFTFPATLSEVGSRAFASCFSLVELINHSTLPSSSGSASTYILTEHDGTSKIQNENGLLFITGDDGKVYLIGEENIPSTLTLPTEHNGSAYEIHTYAFYNCSALSSLTIENGVTGIGTKAFYGCSALRNLSILANITTIGNSAFNNCPIESLTIPSEISFPYTTNALKELTLTGSATIDYYAFSDLPALTRVIIGDGITEIEPNAFRGCTALSYVKIGDGVSVIGDYAFKKCESISTLIIGEGLSSIGYAAFNQATVETIYYEGTATEWSEITCRGGNSSLENATLYTYSEAEPATQGLFWRYVDGIPTVW